MVAGCMLSAGAMVLLATAPDIGGYIAAMLLFGVGSGLLDVAPAAIVGDVAGKRGGTVVAAFQMAGDGGSVSGPVVAGWVADTWSYGTAFWLTAGVLAGAGALAVRSPDITSPAPAEPVLGEPVLEAPATTTEVIAETS
jgi:MFS transporter, DHA1 family, multidrug resistance protein